MPQKRVKGQFEYKAQAEEDINAWLELLFFLLYAKGNGKFSILPVLIIYIDKNGKDIVLN